jgi:hypothetical protein
MRRMPTHGDSSGCLTFLSKCAKAMLIALVAGFAAFAVGGDELRGCGVALFATPAVFLGAMVYLSRTPKWVPPEPRKRVGIKKKPL